MSPDGSETEMTDPATQDVMQGYLAALVDRRDFAQFFAPDVRWTTMETGDQVVGRDAVRDLIVGLHTQAFDAHPQLVDVVVGDGTAMLEARFVGRHVDEFAGVPATGTDVDVPYAVAYRIADGLITELHAYMPVLALRAQLADAATRRTPVAG
jgi:ketosteroid isomerase-like protein